jgi:hypothetical protein
MTDSGARKKGASQTTPAVQALAEAELALMEPVFRADVQELPWAPLLRRLDAEWVDPAPPHHNSSLTRELAARVISCVARGMYHEMAYALGGVTVDTVHKRWFGAARAGVQPFALFRELVEQADLVAQSRHFAVVERAGASGDWRASAWILERRYFAQWGVRKAEQKSGFGSADPRLNGSAAASGNPVSSPPGRVTLELLPPLPPGPESRADTDTHTETAAADAAGTSLEDPPRSPPRARPV